MVVDLKFVKEDNKPFGFRLIGGADFEIPLTVSRVVEGGTAEKSGLKEGDVVVRIQNEATMEMTHEQAHDALVAAGSEFTIGVLRATNLIPQDDAENQEITLPEKTEEQKEQERIDKIISDKVVTDEEIAELLSGEAEVLKDGIIGVNFKKMMPKAGVFKQSEVFQVLNDEQLKSKEELEKEEKHKWTTFLQKPNRPPPTPRNEQQLVNTYRPLIVKQKKPKCAPDFTDETHIQTATDETQEQMEVTTAETKQEEQTMECEEQHYVAEVTQTVTTFSTDEIVQEATSFEEIAADVIVEQVENTGDINQEKNAEEDEISEVSSAFAEQLSSVQTQLLALSHLPKTIQATLDEITKQIEQLIPPNKRKLGSKEATPAIDVTTTNDVDTQQALETQQEQSVDTSEETQQEKEPETRDEFEEQESESQLKPSMDEIEEYEEAQRKLHEEWEYKREKRQDQEPKDAKRELQAELKEKVSQEQLQKQKKAKAGFKGLQPSERPIILPGGRKWRNPKDAYNEEMIAEIISSQAELIMGTTLGNAYESPILGYDNRSISGMNGGLKM